jgi:hypothetical protein
MTAAETFKVVDEIADEWLEMVGDYFVAARVASIMPNPIAWFDKCVPVPEFPQKLACEIEKTLERLNLEIPDGPQPCCGDTARSGWNYCPVCGDELEMISIDAKFESQLHAIVRRRNDARVQLLAMKGGNS